MSTLPPPHIALIMDGNRRWAKENGVPTYDGHKKGIENVKDLLKKAKTMGVKVMSFYCFSTENWKRSKMEVNYLMKLFTKYLTDHLDEMIENGIRVRHIGRKDRLPKSLLSAMTQAEEKSKHLTDITAQFCIDYGGRDELIRAVNTHFSQNSTPLTEEKLATYLDTNPHNEVDLLIRTSGEFRTSNFLMWQLAYSEFHFENTFFPDFTPEKFEKVVEEFSLRKRRFGK